MGSLRSERLGTSHDVSAEAGGFGMEEWLPARMAARDRPRGRVYPDYEVSNLGRIRRKAAGPGAVPGRILKGIDYHKGYDYVNIAGHRMGVARLVCSTWHGDPPSPGCFTRFLDGNTHNVRAENLCWGFGPGWRRN